MIPSEYREYAEKSGLTPTSVQTALAQYPKTSGAPVLLVHQRLDQYAKQVCRDVWGNDFTKTLRVVIDTKKELDKYGWRMSG